MHRCPHQPLLPLLICLVPTQKHEQEKPSTGCAKAISSSRQEKKDGKVEVDWDRVIGRSRDVAGKLNKGVAFLLKKNKVTHIQGFGRLAGAGKVEVEADGSKATYGAQHVIIATGSRPRDLPVLKIDEDRI